jgi:hypothetical protein
VHWRPPASFLVGGSSVEYWWPAVAFGLAGVVGNAPAELAAAAVAVLACAALWFINRNLWALAALPVLFLASRVDDARAAPALGLLRLLPAAPGRALVDPHPHEQGRLPVLLIGVLPHAKTRSSGPLWRSWSARKAHWPPATPATSARRSSPVFGVLPDSSATFQPTPRPWAAGRRQERGDRSTSAGAPARYGPARPTRPCTLPCASARSYLVARGVSPLKIMVNFASAADFVADNSTAEGRRENQRVDIEVVHIPTY